MGASVQGGVIRGRPGHLPTWNWCLGTRGVSAPGSYIISERGVDGRMDTESNRFITPCHGHTQEMCCGHHFSGRLECDKCFGL